MIKADLEDLIREQWLRARERGDIVWETRDGKQIPIKDMTDQHLENAIRCITAIDERNEIVADNSSILDF